jgi:hypothetical protein
MTAAPQRKEATSNTPKLKRFLPDFPDFPSLVVSVTALLLWSLVLTASIAEITS